MAFLIAALALSAVAWKLMCGYLRKRRSRLLGALDPRKDTQAINVHTLYVEFPFLIRRSLEFGIFRGFGIPEISRVLQKGGHFACNASKRYDNTDILMQEMLHHHVDGDRGSLALRRLNFLHSHYPIHNADYLYVLSLFVLLPMEWCSVYGYREWTEVEKTAYYSAWHDIGTRMGIRNMPSGISAFSQYRGDYEAKHMVYADCNKELAESTMRMFLSNVPPLLWPLARKLAYSVMDDRLLKAVGYPKQPTWLSALSHSLLKLHGMAVGWLLTPRPLSCAQIRIPAGCPKSQGFHFDPEAVYKLAFQFYKPSAYEKGYRIKELGVTKPGQLGNPFEGELLCPLRECSNLRWPHCLSNKCNKSTSPVFDGLSVA